MVFILVNTKSHNNSNSKTIDEVVNKFGKDCYKIIDIIGFDVQRFLKAAKPDDEVIVVGGDGTLMHFCNDVYGIELPCKCYFYGAGTGNDFGNDMKDYIEDGRILLNEVVKRLPTVIVKGKSYKFVNGIGYGIDGWCCEEADRLQAKRNKPVSYRMIALKGLILNKYKRVTAKVTVDGETLEFKKVYICPTMKGKFYGGNMLVAPKQERFDKDGLVSSIVMYGPSKLKALLIFASIYKGEHEKHKKMICIRKGHHVKVEFDRPCALQIDGETILDVTNYEVIAE